MYMSNSFWKIAVKVVKIKACIIKIPHSKNDKANITPAGTILANLKIIPWAWINLKEKSAKITVSKCPDDTLIHSLNPKDRALALKLKISIGTSKIAKITGVPAGINEEKKFKYMVKLCYYCIRKA